MLITLAADPLAGLVETAFIGRLGAVELAGMAVGLSIFSTITKFLNIPLISSTTTGKALSVRHRMPASHLFDLMLWGQCRKLNSEFLERSAFLLIMLAQQQKQALLFNAVP